MKKALILLIITGVIWIVADVYFSWAGDSTISQALKKVAWDWKTLPAVFGILCGHFFLNVPVVLFRSIRNILLTIYLVWLLGWDLGNGIFGNPSFATCSLPPWIAFYIHTLVGRLLWPQEKN